MLLLKKMNFRCSQKGDIIREFSNMASSFYVFLFQVDFKPSGYVPSGKSSFNDSEENPVRFIILRNMTIRY